VSFVVEGTEEWRYVLSKDIKTSFFRNLLSRMKLYDVLTR
jgi:hypothetical protein